MINFFNKNQNCSNENNIPIQNKELKIVLKNYTFHYALQIINKNDSPTIYNNFIYSKIIVIYSYEESGRCYFLIGFEKTIILIEQSSLFLLKNLFSNNSNPLICFSPGSKSVFDGIKKIQYIESEIISECKEFYSCLTTTKENDFFKPIMFCVSQYLIKKSYMKLTQKNRLKDLFNIGEQIADDFNEDDYIRLKLISTGSYFKANLVYLIKNEELAIIKDPYEKNIEIPKLIKREKENYEKLKHPLLPKYYGLLKSTNYFSEEGIVIEYIYGTKLSKIQLSEKEKIKIIFEIMILISYFHKNKKILRDLRPDNIIIDHNKTVVFVDFDRVINDDDDSHSKNLSTNYLAPEIFNGIVSFKSDIYSLGKIIYFIMIEKAPTDINFLKYNDFGDNSTLKKIFENCIVEDPQKRKNIQEIINIFFEQYNNSIDDIDDILNIYIGYDILFSNPEELFKIGMIGYTHKKIDKCIHFFNLASNQNFSEAQYCLGVIYNEGKYVKQDINKAIKYYSLAADQNHLNAMFNLGVIFLEGEYITRDITKTIHYFTLAANKNHSQAQYCLGIIYNEGKYVKRDISKSIYYYSLAAKQNHVKALYNLGVIYDGYHGNLNDIDKSIYYYSLAANQNCPEALYNLGVIYDEGIYIKRDIKKSIHYYSLAANQNHLQAQFNLGIIYLQGQYLSRDINNAIYLLTSAANQNYPNAQYTLGSIFLTNEYVQRNIDKSIYYYSLAANQNHLQDQYNLGFIYHEGKYVQKDINKSIHYFMLAANQNHLQALYNLGCIYYEGKDIQKDINKAIHYFVLAANLNYEKAQFTLGVIYDKGEDVLKDMNNAIYYYTCAAKNNNSNAQFNLGYIYYEGKYVDRDIEKSIFYYSLAANQNHMSAQFNLGSIYYVNRYIKRDIGKAINYYSLAAKQNHPNALYILGLIYFEGIFIQQDIKKAFDYFNLAAKQNNTNAQLLMGIFYYIGFFTNKNINKSINFFKLASIKNDPLAHFELGFYYHNKNIKTSIRHYKLASIFKSKYARNNLGIIYKNRYGNEHQKNIGIAINYFDDLIKNENDILSLYNLAHIFIYDENSNDRIEKSIDYLINASNQNFSPANDLLCIAFIKKYGFNLEIINEKLHEKIKNDLCIVIYNKIFIEKLHFKSTFEEKYKYLKTIDFLYDFLIKPIHSKDLDKQNSSQQNIIPQNVTSDFYDGFKI